MKLKVMTFNIMSGKSHMDPEHPVALNLMADAVNSANPDIVGFNEVRNGPGDADNWKIGRYPCTPLYFEKYIGGVCRFAQALNLGDGKGYGNALLTKLPLKEFDTIAIPDPAEAAYERGYESRSIGRGIIETEKGPIMVLTSHFGLKRPEQVNAVETALKLVNESNMPCILMGDFNMGDYDELMKKIAAVMTDTAAFCECLDPTFPSDKPRGRIDFIFAKGFKVLSAAPVNFIASDHLPLMAELEL